MRDDDDEMAKFRDEMGKYLRTIREQAWLDRVDQIRREPERVGFVMSGGLADAPPLAPARDRGKWFQTFSGRAFYPTDPDPSEVFIVDIAHALSNICRFGGHAREFYSVAQHCLAVSLVLAPPKELDLLAGATSPAGQKAYESLIRIGLSGLLHDAAEAYIGDMVSPIKSAFLLSGYRQIESAVEDAIAKRFDLSRYDFAQPGVETADRRMLFTERRHLRDEPRSPEMKWDDVEKYPPYDDVVIRPQPAGATKEAYLERFGELWQRRKGQPWSEDP